MRALQQARGITEHHTCRRQGFAGVGQQRFVIRVGVDKKKRAGFALGVFGNNWFEVVIESAIGGVVEFFGIGGFVRGNVIGFWRIGG